MGHKRWSEQRTRKAIFVSEKFVHVQGSECASLHHKINKWVSTQISESLNILALLWVGRNFKISRALLVSSYVQLISNSWPPRPRRGRVSSRYFRSDLPARLLVHEGPSSLAPTRLPSARWWWQTSRHSAWLSWAPLLHGCLLSFHGLHVSCGPSGLSLSWGEDAWFAWVHPIQLGLSFVWGRKEEGQRTEGWWRGEMIYFLVMLQYIQIQSFPSTCYLNGAHTF